MSYLFRMLGWQVVGGQSRRVVIRQVEVEDSSEIVVLLQGLQRGHLESIVEVFKPHITFEIRSENLINLPKFFFMFILKISMFS